MQPLPAQDLRSNRGTWAVSARHLPALGHWMHDALPNESFDPRFYGQNLETFYFDTPSYDLRKARLRKEQYCTLRIRSYPNGTYALSAKTDDRKFRIELPIITAESFLTGKGDWQSWLPVEILARLMGLVDDANDLIPVVVVYSRRYAIENETDRFTLDTCVNTSRGKCLSFHVLEYKSTGEERELPPVISAMKLEPIKLSKFLWSTEI